MHLGEVNAGFESLSTTLELCDPEPVILKLQLPPLEIAGNNQLCSSIARKERENTY